MTTKDKYEAIQKYCDALMTGSGSCKGCLIEGICDTCAGHFEGKVDLIERAYCKIRDLKDGHDNVNHPAHYETGKYECIDVMREAIGEEAVKSFCICNAFKYIYRCNNKHDSPLEDVKKAIWYLTEYVKMTEDE